VIQIMVRAPWQVHCFTEEIQEDALKASINVLVLVLVIVFAASLGCANSSEETEGDSNDPAEDDDDDNDSGDDDDNDATLGPDEWESAQNNYEQLLEIYVDDSGLVDYPGLMADRADLDAFANAISLISYDRYRFESDLSDQARLAFWINAYNLFTLQLILDHYPVASIRDIGDPWDAFTFNVGSEPLTLNQIEHEIIRKEFNEPRIHFAVNCASISCPKLQRSLYPADDLDTALDRATADFANNPALHLDAKPGDEALRITVLLLWYAGDFGGLAGALELLAGHITDPDTSAFVRNFPVNKLKYISYDWDLNEQQ
jgi:Protein of unknown function, DUF547